MPLHKVLHAAGSERSTAQRTLMPFAGSARAAAFFAPQRERRRTQRRAMRRSSFARRLLHQPIARAISKARDAAQTPLCAVTAAALAHFRPRRFDARVFLPARFSVHSFSPFISDTITDMAPQTLRDTPSLAFRAADAMSRYFLFSGAFFFDFFLDFPLHRLIFFLLLITCLMWQRRPMPQQRSCAMFIFIASSLPSILSSSSSSLRCLRFSFFIFHISSDACFSRAASLLRAPPFR